MRLRVDAPLDDNLLALCREGAANMLAMQHREDTNFARRDTRGKQETYTAGAFRYGMFETGEFMTEGTGWFVNPSHLDYIRGGVLNGRALWALGEVLKHDPNGPLAPQLAEAMALGVRFCLGDAVALGYARRTEAGNVYWYDAGEHGYLLLGMLAACEAVPELVVLRPKGGPEVTLRQACVAGLDALVDLELPHHQWSVYTNKDPLAIAALATGAKQFPAHAHANRWREVAMRVADAWLEARAPDYPAPLVHFGLRVEPAIMTFNWSRLTKREADNHNTIHFYLTGHWIHALADLHALTGEMRYRRRAEAMISYLCGDNPWRVRLLNELGGVYNWVDDTDGDGIEDRLKQDMYPESTCFCQIGIMRLTGAWPRRLGGQHTYCRPDRYPDDPKPASLSRTPCTVIRKMSPDYKTLTPHLLRHTAAMHLIRAGNDLSSVAYWLGHAHLNTTHIYVEIDMEAKRRMLDKTHPPQPTSPPPWRQPDLLDWLNELTPRPPVM